MPPTAGQEALDGKLFCIWKKKHELFPGLRVFPQLIQHGLPVYLKLSYGLAGQQ